MTQFYAVSPGNAVGPEHSNSVQVPEGGSTVLFVAVAMLAIMAVMARRLLSKLADCEYAYCCTHGTK